MKNHIHTSLTVNSRTASNVNIRNHIVIDANLILALHLCPLISKDRIWEGKLILDLCLRETCVWSWDLCPVCDTFSITSLVEEAQPCSISGAVKLHSSSDRAQFLNASVPVPESSREEGLMILHILLCPGKGTEIKILEMTCNNV